MRFSEQLKFVRFKKKLTQKELASILEISPGAIYKYENELMSPGYKIIKKFESYLTSNSAELSMPLLDDISEDSEYGEVTPGKEINMQVSDYINSQKRTIQLLENEIVRLEDKIKYLKIKGNHSKPAYHFKMVSTYKAETDEWLDTDIFGDFSMTGFTYEEMVPLMNEENDNNSWIDRYHPDSKVRLDKHTLKNIKTDYHYLKWDHMMWKAKNGKYECYNIDLLYIRAEEKVTSMFYWVNGDKE
jgi:transcriptional regulator with XRE-family HTH domain